MAAVAILACACTKEGGDKGDVVTEALAVPGNVVCSASTETSLTFTWNEVKGATNYGYKLLDGMTLVKDGSVENASVTIDGLTSSKTYRFAVKSVNAKESTKYSDYVEGTTGKSDSPDTPDTPDVPDPEPETDVYAALKIPAAEEDGVTRAFPGAEGGGMYTTGGRGGKILHVTTTADNTEEGSLRWAVSQKGARTIVFDVAGIITLSSPLEIKNGDLTIAGQTAPGAGICIKGRYTRISADNIIIRFVRFRLGDEDDKASDSDDTIWGRYCRNIILDHCSMSWSIDECASFYSNSNMTMQWCYLAESMKASKHTKGSHGYGGIWGGENVSFHHNVLAHHDSRNPRFDHPHIYENHTNPSQRGVIDYRNNIVYDWGSNSSYGGEGYGAGKGDGINMVANYYKPGPSSTDRKYFMDAYGVYTSTCSTCGSNNIEDGYPLMYMDGNVHTKYADITSDNASGIYWHQGSGHTNYQSTSSSQFAVKGPAGQACYTTTHTAEGALNAALAYGGASLSRDLVDDRTSSDVKNGKGKIIDCVTAADGKVSVSSLYNTTWPKYNATDEQKAIAATDSDKDGIPDYYETVLGLDKNDASDGQTTTIDKSKRYSNFELYLHYLVREIMSAENQGGTYTQIQ